MKTPDLEVEMVRTVHRGVKDQVSDILPILLDDVVVLLLHNAHTLLEQSSSAPIH
jgi:hypothetical protein